MSSLWRKSSILKISIVIILILSIGLNIFWIVNGMIERKEQDDTFKLDLAYVLNNIKYAEDFSHNIHQPFTSNVDKNATITALIYSLFQENEIYLQKHEEDVPDSFLEWNKRMRATFKKATYQAEITGEGDDEAIGQAIKLLNGFKDDYEKEVGDWYISLESEGVLKKIDDILEKQKE